MAIHSRHFRLIDPQARNRQAFIPGYSGPVHKNLVNTLPRIEQTGLADTSDVAALRANKGNVTVTTTVDAQYLGSYADCYKEDVEIQAIPGAGGTVSYRIIYQQISIAS